MIVTIDKEIGSVTVKKEQDDPIFRWSGWSDPESKFLYRVKLELQKQGYDCIKKRMWKDGHMVDDRQQYIRDRKDNWYIYNGNWSIYDAGEEFNERGVIYLRYIE